MVLLSPQVRLRLSTQGRFSNVVVCAFLFWVVAKPFLLGCRRVQEIAATHWGPAFPDLDPKTPDLGQIMVPNLTFGSKSGILPFLPKYDLFVVQI
jgi:hypothetical protein